MVVTCLDVPGFDSRSFPKSWVLPCRRRLLLTFSLPLEEDGGAAVQVFSLSPGAMPDGAAGALPQGETRSAALKVGRAF